MITEISALWPYILVNVVLLLTAGWFLVSFLRNRKVARLTEERRIALFKKKEKDMLLRYQTIFNTALSDMVFYNAKGVLTNLNQKACETFGKTREEMLNGHYTIDEYLNGATLESFERFHAVQLPDTPDGMYYEVQVVPIRNRKHQLLGFFRTGCDISETVRFSRNLREGSKKLVEANNSLRTYIDNINYVLKVGGVRLATYSPQSHTLSIYEDSDTVKFTLTQTRCMSLIDEKSKRTAMRMLNSMDNLKDKNIEVHLRTILRQKDGLPLQLHLKFHPTYDEHGRVKGYFGLCRDESEVAGKEQQLALESKKAQEVEHVKNVFLRNMSYEIRTPLTSVVGFAELLDQSETPEDEEMFIDQIKDNSTHLLHLINDILYLSRLDAHMIEVKKQPTNVAATFGGYCENGWLDNKKPGVTYNVENAFHRMVVLIDDTHLGHIIAQVTANAAQNTDSGSVTARFDYYNNKLVIAVSDTGCGISKEVQDHIFERFIAGANGGTGLGLPISKELAEQMGGTITINSDPGHGTTVWITIPCQLIEIERKKSL